MKKFLRKNKIILIMFIILMLVIFGISIFLVLNNNKETELYDVNKDDYYFKYDSTWELTKENDTEIELLHKKSNSKLNIIINELDEDIQYKELTELFDILLYNIQTQNENYNLINRENSKISKNSIDGYKMLFEAGENQVAVYFYRQGSKLIVFTYEASNDYFDIVLDSANNIIYNFILNDQRFDVETSINIETGEITYTEQEDIVAMLEDTREEVVTIDNYTVNYTLPSNFELIEESNIGFNKEKKYEFQGLSSEKNLKLKLTLQDINIYEYLDRDNPANIYETFIFAKNNENDILNKLSDNPLTYILRNDSSNGNKILENIAILFAPRKTHTLKVEISSEGVGIPEEIIKMIKINNWR